MIPHDAREHHAASSGRISNELMNSGNVQRIGSNTDPRRVSAAYLRTIHTITTMNNDTGTGSDDSQVPFILEGNEAADPSVAPTMSDFTDTQPPQTPSTDLDSAAAAVAPTMRPEDTGPADMRPEDMGSDDTGEMDAVPPTSPVEAPIPSAIEPAPFDYDDYYADDAAWASAAAVAPAAVEPPKKKNRDGALFFVGALAAALLGAALTVGLLAATGTLTTDAVVETSEPVAAPAVATPATPAPVIESTIINELGSAVNPSAVAVKTLPSIVTVSTADVDGNVFGSGSGVVLTADGLIATNKHVVDGAQSLSVIFEDGRVYSADLVGADPLTDLAVLRIEADNLTPIDLGSTDDLALGDPAVAIGNPLGQAGGSSISVGIVSAFDRRVEFGDSSALVGMLQTDAAINSGSSGGALVNAEGELIGITAAIGVSNAGPEGIGYAIPVEVVERITAEIIEEGDVDHPFLGVTITDYQVELDDGGIIPAGALVATIEGTDSAAGSAGLQPDDVIVRIGDKEIISQNDLILAVRLYRVGDEVEFVVLRDGVEESFNVVMGQRPAEFGG
jgi:S1-C subfamily serine protease